MATEFKRMAQNHRNAMKALQSFREDPGSDTQQLLVYEADHGDHSCIYRECLEMLAEHPELKPLAVKLGRIHYTRVSDTPVTPELCESLTRTDILAHTTSGDK